MRGKILGIACLALVIMTTAASGEEVTRLRSLGWDDHVLTLDLDGPYQIKTMVLDKPDRVVLDLPNVRSTLGVHDFTGSGAVVGIRVGQNEAIEASGLRCRVVVDLDRKTDFHISESGTGIQVVFSDAAVVLPKGVALTQLPEVTQESEIREPAPAEPIAVSSNKRDDTPEPTPDVAPVAPGKIMSASVGQMLFGGSTQGEQFTIPSRERLRAIASGQVKNDEVPTPQAIPDTGLMEVVALSNEEKSTPADQQSEVHVEFPAREPVVAEAVELVTDPVAVDAETVVLAADPVAVEAEAVELVADPVAVEAEVVMLAEEPVIVQAAAPQETPISSEPLSLLDWLDTERVEQDAAPAVQEIAVVEPEQAEPVQEVKAPPLVLASAATGLGTNLNPRQKAPAEAPEDKPVQAEKTQESGVASSGDNPTADSSKWFVETSADIKKSSVLGVKDTGNKDGDKKKGAWTEQIKKARQASGAFTLDSNAAVKPDTAPISLEMRGAEFKTLLRAFSDFSGQNIISGQDVKGKVSVKLKAVPWFEGLQAVCGAHGFGVHEEFGILRVAPAGVLEQEEMARLTRGKKRTEYEPMVTKMVVLRFAVAGDMTESLQRMLSERGKVDVDARSNTLLITDAEENVDRVIKIAEKLDHTVPQVEITARIVDVDYYASRDMGIRWDALNVVSDKANLVGSAVLDGSLLDPVGEVKVGTIQDWGDLSLTIQAMEKENKANVISNPRVMTMDNIEATILVGKKIPLIVADEAGNAITQLTTIGIKLVVTPHINSDGQVMMELHTEVSDLASEATVQGGVIINTHESTSNVMVDNQQTAVIAGLIRSSETNLDQKIPFLGKIPLVKHLFGYENTAKNKRELIIFVTPRIVPSGADILLDTADLKYYDEDLSLNN
jgi:type IV pilus assembly protein PilQ